MKGTDGAAFRNFTRRILGSATSRFGLQQDDPIMRAKSMPSTTSISSSSVPICRDRVVRVQQQEKFAVCEFANRTKLLVSRFLGSYVFVGDDLAFPVPTEDAVGTEILINKNAGAGRNRYLYHVPIGYVSQPKQDKRNQLFVSAEVDHGALGISTVFLPCEVLRDYFYRLPQTGDRGDHATLYEILRIPANASPSELRVAFKLRDLELRTAGAPRSQRVALERAFNIVSQPELRACYDALLADPEAPAYFRTVDLAPYWLLVSHRVTDKHSSLAAFLHFHRELRRRRFHVPLRRCDFYDDRALCRDARRKLEFWLDPAALHTIWDRTWNQWKHLLGTKIEVEGTFVQTGKYRKRSGDWDLVIWETALPSRLEVKLPA